MALALTWKNSSTSLSIWAWQTGHRMGELAGLNWSAAWFLVREERALWGGGGASQVTTLHAPLSLQPDRLGLALSVPAG